MARETILRGPNYVHPEKPSAVGSRNSANRHNRDEYQEARGVIDEEVDKILNHIHAKLPLKYWRSSMSWVLLNQNSITILTRTFKTC